MAPLGKLNAGGSGKRLTEKCWTSDAGSRGKIRWKA
jgi:hypothetical protein